jgi:uncharacterized protein YjiK
MVLKAVREWMAATRNVATLVSGLNFADGVAVDGSGNVYIAYSGRGEILEYLTANGNQAALVSGLNFGKGVAVDSGGNIYIADTDNNAIKELPHAYVDKLEGLAAGVDSLSAELPTAPIC